MKLTNKHGAEIHANVMTLAPGENEVTSEQFEALKKDPAVSIYLTCGLVVAEKPEPKAEPKGGK